MLVIGIAGGTGSGKTTVVNKILQGLNAEGVNVLSQDNYYHDNQHLSLNERKAEAHEIIRAASGTRFDPQVVNALLRTQEI